MEGHKLGQDDQVRHLQRDLQSDMYRDTDARHKDMLIKLRVGTLQYTTVYHSIPQHTTNVLQCLLQTTEMANKDLEKYYKALDRSVGHGLRNHMTPTAWSCDSSHMVM